MNEKKRTTAPPAMAATVLRLKPLSRAVRQYVAHCGGGVAVLKIRS